MQFSTLITSAALLISYATANDLPREASSISAADAFPGYTAGIATISGNYFGNEYTLNRTVQDVRAQLEVLYPGLAARSPTPEPTELATRGTANKDGLLCIPVASQDWTECSTLDNQKNVRALTLEGRVTIGAKHCDLIACHGHAGVWFCNDKYVPIDPAMVYIASYVQDVVERCENGMTGGQAFDTDDYSVVVRYGCNI